MKTKKIFKNIIIFVWIIYIIIQFFFFVPFKTFGRTHDVHYNTTYYYKGRIIKPLWHDEAYTQIDFPLLLTQAGVVTVVMGTIYLTLTKDKKDRNVRNHNE